jgi:hypothetical protein
MGCGTFTSSDWSSYTTSRGYSATSTVSDMYKSTSVKTEMEPVGVTYRESCDSDEHPNSTPIILGLDVTGSMGSVLETVSKKLNTLITEIYDREPVKDPQIMIMAFGDVECDRHPLQVSQFESDIRIAEQLNDVYFERGGGGNDGESYTLPWYFAARHTKIDSFEKRGKKGFLFTMGDEPYLTNISKKAIKKFVGDDIQADLTAEELLTEVSRQYEVYHLMIEEGCGMRMRGSNVVDQWTNLLGQRAILVSDCTKIPEIIVSILEVAAGKDAKEVIDSWDGSTSVAVSKAINGLTTVDDSKELVEF